MDGATLIRELRQIITESSNSSWMDARSCYDYLWDAAKETADKIRAFTTTQSITTIASTSSYNLEPDFLRLHLTDDENKYFIKYYDGSNTYFIYYDDYASIYLANNTTAISIPTCFCITDSTSLSQLTGTATSTGSLTNPYTIFGNTLGKTTLTDTAATFVTNKVFPGDLIHNTTDGSSGIVLSVTSETVLICALFDGTNNYFTSTDSYIINRQARFKLVVDPPSLTAGHTITIPYIQRPAPVYDYYSSYNFAPGYRGPLVYYAAWKFKYRDREPNFGDTWYKYWDNQLRILSNTVDSATRPGRGYKVNLVKRASRTGTR